MDELNKQSIVDENTSTQPGKENEQRAQNVSRGEHCCTGNAGG